MKQRRRIRLPGRTRRHRCRADPRRRRVDTARRNRRAPWSAGWARIRRAGRRWCVRRPSPPTRCPARCWRRSCRRRPWRRTPVSAPTAARPASSDGPCRLRGDVAADLGLVPGVLRPSRRSPRSSVASRRRCRRARPRRAGLAARQSSASVTWTDERQAEVARLVGPPVRAAQTRGGQFGVDAVGPELARHLGEHLLACGEVDGQVERTDPDLLWTCLRAATSRCVPRRRSTERRGRRRRGRSSPSVRG